MKDGYRVLIVEDEVLTRAGMVSAVNWESLGLILVAQANDGKQALQLFQTYMPDILITDIRMPRMDGIEMLRTILKDNPSCKVIVITCIDDVHIIQQLFQLKVSHVLLKSTMTLQDLQKHLLEVKKELQEHHHSTTLQDPVDENSVLSDYLLKKRSSLPYQRNPYIMMFQIPAKQRDKALVLRTVLDLLAGYYQGFSEIIYAVLGGENVVVCFKDENIPKEKLVLRAELFQLYLKNALNIDLYCNMEFTDENEGSESMRETVATYYTLYRNVCFKEYGVFENSILYFSNWITKVLRMYSFCIYCDVARKEYRKCVVNPILDLCEDGRIDFRKYKETVIIGLEKFGANLFLFTNSENTENKNLLARCNTFFGVYLQFQKILEKREKILISPVEHISGIDKAIAYIQKNYRQKIFLNDVAQEISLSPSYFSALFKKCMGTSFASYLLNFRIYKSLSLLDSEDCYLYEIAEKINMADNSHYSKTFKSIMGISPNSWKKYVKAVHVKELYSDQTE